MDIYEIHGRKIFSRSYWKGVASVGGLFDEKYEPDNMEEILADYFGTTKLGEALIKVLISSYDIEMRKPLFFKSWQDKTSKVQMDRVARATSAAPTYFPPARVSIDNLQRTLVDGGVFANNPAMCAYAEARKLWPDEKEILVVSIGTGELNRPILFEDANNWGLAEWARPIMNVVFDGVSDAVNYQLRQILGGNYFRFQRTLGFAVDDLDNTTKEIIHALKMEARAIMDENPESWENLWTAIG